MMPLKGALMTVWLMRVSSRLCSASATSSAVLALASSSSEVALCCARRWMRFRLTLGLAGGGAGLVQLGLEQVILQSGQ